MHDDEPDSAMGSSSEPGSARPKRADEAEGLGGAGTEGKPGAPDGGTEPHLPEDVAEPHASQEDLRLAAERVARGHPAEHEEDAPEGS